MKTCLKNKLFQVQNSVSTFIWWYQRFLWLPCMQRFLFNVTLSICKVVHIACKSPSWFVYTPRETSPVSFPQFLLCMHFGNVTEQQFTHVQFFSTKCCAKQRLCHTFSCKHFIKAVQKAFKALNHSVINSHSLSVQDIVLCCKCFTVSKSL